MLDWFFQCWMMAFMSRVLMVDMGIESRTNVFCIVDLGARFCHIHVSLKALDC